MAIRHRGAKSASRCSARTAAYRTETLEKGDVGYIPQGYGHSIENVGDKPCRVLIGFNTGIYEAINLSQWIAGNPADVLATNFSQPAALFEKFPHKEVFIAVRMVPANKTELRFISLASRERKRPENSGRLRSRLANLLVPLTGSLRET